MSVWLALCGVAGGGAALAWCQGARTARVAVGPQRSWGAVLAHVPAVAALLDAQQRKAVREECLEGLPRLLDLLTLGLSAGLSFDAALDLYLQDAAGALPRALEKAEALWQVGACSREQALEAMAAGLEAPSLQRFAAAVAESLEFGVPLAATLRRQALAIRQEHRGRVEEAIERAPVRMLGPLAALVVPAMLLAVLGPLLSGAFSAL